jgi:hypothetical protein
MKIPFDVPLRIITPYWQPHISSTALWVIIANPWLCHTRPKWFTENEIFPLRLCVADTAQPGVDQLEITNPNLLVVNRVVLAHSYLKWFQPSKTESFLKALLTSKRSL